MEIKVRRKRCSYISSADNNQINAILYVPSTMYAYIQIFIDICEKKERYDELASFLARLGFLVGIVEYRGHGENMINDCYKGHFGKKDGLNNVLLDQLTFFNNITRNNELNGYIFADGFGCVIALDFLRNNQDIVNGIVLSSMPRYLSYMRHQKTILEITTTENKEKIESNAFSNLIGKYTRKIKNPKTNHDWLSYDQANIANYVEDADCGFKLTNKSYMDLLDCFWEVYESDWLSKSNRLPILMLAGKDDPLVNYPKGFNENINNLYIRGFKNITAHVYENMRHQIFKETDRVTVYKDIVSWINKYLINKNK